MPDPLTVHAVLARFDRALGLDVSPRPLHGSSDSSGVTEPRTVVQVKDVVHAPTDMRAVVAAPAGARVQVAAPAGVRDARVAATSLAPAGSREERMARLAEIESRHAATCQLCAVSGAKAKLVFGEGAPDAEIMFVGEVPGEPEERAGRPFMGPAGEKLDEMIRAMGLTRADVYIASVIKSRLPGDRAPTPEDIAACGPYLLEQVLAVQPRVLVTLGGPATKWICGVDAGISRIRGTWQSWTPPAGASCPSIPVMPTYHPSYVLRTYTRQVRAEVWSDLRAVLARIGRAVPTRAAATDA
jgi:DNA polymerase